MGEHFSKADWVTPAVVGLLGLAAAVAVQYRPDRADLATVVFPPWWSDRAAVAAAASAGDVLAVGGFARAVAVRSEAPGLERRARAAGAILVLRGTTAGLCAAPEPEAA